MLMMVLHLMAEREGRNVRNASGFSAQRLGRMHQTMSEYVEDGVLPGLVTLVSRCGETHVDAIGDMAFEGSEPMRRDTIFRIASMTKPIAAAAAMILVEEGALRLDDPVDPLLPELAGRRVLKSVEGPISDTVPANRSITIRDLLTFQLGLGVIMAPPDRYPVQRAIAEAGLAAGPIPPQLTPDAWMARLGELPLIHQPGAAWMYHTGSDILGVLIARASGRSLGEFLRERIFEPLGMKDTAFYVPPDKWDRLPPTYAADVQTGALTVHDSPSASLWRRAPLFESGGGGLVSTADDYLAFCRMMLAKGRSPGGRILSEETVELMTADHLTPEQRAAALVFFGDTRSWGFGLAVPARRDGPSTVPDRFGWDGGMGTSGYWYPKEDLATILLTQRLMDSPDPPGVFRDFWKSAYEAI